MYYKFVRLLEQVHHLLQLKSIPTVRSSIFLIIWKYPLRFSYLFNARPWIYSTLNTIYCNIFNVAFIAEVHCTNKDTYIFSTEIISMPHKPNEKKILHWTLFLSLYIDTWIFMALVAKFPLRLKKLKWKKWRQRKVWLSTR